MTSHPETFAENPEDLLDVQAVNRKAEVAEFWLAFSIFSSQNSNSTVMVWQPDRQGKFLRTEAELQHFLVISHLVFDTIGDSFANAISKPDWQQFYPEKSQSAELKYKPPVMQRPRVEPALYV